jgi:hypothetical protein
LRKRTSAVAIEEEADEALSGVEEGRVERRSKRRIRPLRVPAKMRSWSALPKLVSPVPSSFKGVNLERTHFADVQRKHCPVSPITARRVAVHLSAGSRGVGGNKDFSVAACEVDRLVASCCSPRSNEEQRGELNSPRATRSRERADVHKLVLRGARVTEASEMESVVVPTIA